MLTRKDSLAALKNFTKQGIRVIIKENSRKNFRECILKVV